MVEVFLLPGRAVDEQTLQLPPEIHACVEMLVEAYHIAIAKGVKPLVIVSGRQRSKFVYKNRPLRYPNGQEVVEADLLAPLLEHQGVPCKKERRSASVGDNFAYSKQLLLDLPVPIRPASLHIFTISSLTYRLWVLAKLVFGLHCDIHMHSAQVETQDPEETRKLEIKLLGDQVCMLLGSCMSHRMTSGDHRHIIGDDQEVSQWPVLGREHDAVCPYAPQTSHPAHMLTSLLQGAGIIN